MVPSAGVRKRAGLGLLMQLDQPGFSVDGDTGVIGRFGLVGTQPAPPRTGTGKARRPRSASASSSMASSDDESDEDSSFSDSGSEGGGLLLDMKGTEFVGALSRVACTLLLVEVKAGKGTKKAAAQGESVVVEQLIDHVVDITSTRSCLETLGGENVKEREDNDWSDGGSDSDFAPGGGRRRSSTSTLTSNGTAGRGRGRGRGGRGGKSGGGAAKKKKAAGKGARGGRGGRGRGRGGKGSGGGTKQPKKKASAATTVTLAELVRKRAKAEDGEAEDGQEEGQEEISEYGTVESDQRGAEDIYDDDDDSE